MNKFSWSTVLILIGAALIYLLELNKPSKPPEVVEKSPTTEQVSEHNGYELFQRCRLVDDRGNDGDSFLVKLEDGREVKIRLYFVDAPESQFRTYRNGENNHDRIAEQATSMGGKTSLQIVNVGKAAKDWTRRTLGTASFRIYTKWDDPFGDERYHAHVEVMLDGRKQWLHRTLVELGLARIHTKPADMPDGTPANDELVYLKEAEKLAKRSRFGAWRP